MSILKAQERDVKANGKQLRKAGIIPAVLFGKHLEESINIQIPKGDVELFLRSNSTGSKLDLMVGKKKYMALLKNVTLTPATNALEHLGFQVMTAGEKVTSEFHIHLHNRAKVDGIVQQFLSQVHYKATPDHLFEKVDVELEGKVVGDSAILSDLEISKSTDIEILTPLDSLVYSIAHRLTKAETVAEEAAEAATEEAAAEAPAAEETKE